VTLKLCVCYGALPYWHLRVCNDGATSCQPISARVLYKISRVQYCFATVIACNTSSFSIELEILTIIPVNSLYSHVGFEGLKVLILILFRYKIAVFLDPRRHEAGKAAP